MDGELLSSVEIGEIEGHVEDCTICVQTLETLSGVVPALLAEHSSGDQDPYVLEAKCQEAVEKIVRAVNPHVFNAESARQAAADEFETLGPYEVIAKLGAGGVGVVYKAKHIHLGRIVALKVLHKADYQEAISRFFREMKAVGSISHPNIVRATDGGVQDDRHYLVMEYLPGTDLSNLSKTHGPLRISDACELVRQAAMGLQHVHDQKMVHRDIKPRNLMLVEPDPKSSPPVVKILDLGLAALGTAGIEPEALTLTGQVMGTLDYMARNRRWTATWSTFEPTSIPWEPRVWQQILAYWFSCILGC